MTSPTSVSSQFLDSAYAGTVRIMDAVAGGTVSAGRSRPRRSTLPGILFAAAIGLLLASPPLPAREPVSIYSGFLPVSSTMAVDADGMIHVAFDVRKRFSPESREIFIATSSDGGSSFETRSLVSGQTRYPQVAVGPEGVVYVAYVEGEIDRDDPNSPPPTIKLLRAPGPEAPFLPPVRISTGSADEVDLETSIAVDGSGRLYVVWVESEEYLDTVPHLYFYRVYMRTSDDGGETFSAPVLVQESRNDPLSNPRIAVTPAGEVHVTWGLCCSSNGFHLYYSHAPDGHDFSITLLVDSDVQLYAGPGQEKLATSPGGAASIAYVKERRQGGGPVSNVYHARIFEGKLLDRTRLSHVSRPFDAYSPGLTVNDAGEIRVAWQGPPVNAVPGDPHDIFWSTAADGRTFSGAIPIREDSDLQSFGPTLASDEGGTPLIVWREARPVPEFPIPTTGTLWFQRGEPIGIHSVELTQAIQEWQTLRELKRSLRDDGEPPVPLIAGKAAVLRVYALPPDEPAIYRLLAENLSGNGTTEEQELTLDPRCRLVDRRRGEHGCRSADYYFEPPEGSWTIHLELHSEDRELIEEHDLPFEGRRAGELILRGVSVRDLDGNVGSASDLPDLAAETLSKVAPTHRVRVVNTGHTQHLPDVLFDLDHDGEFSEDEIEEWWVSNVDRLQRLASRTSSSWPPEATTKLVGMVAPTLRGYNGISSGIPGDAAMSLSDHPDSLAHELGHLLGQRHTNTDVPNRAAADSDGDGHPDGPYCWGSKDSATDWVYADNLLRSGPAPGALEVGFDLDLGEPVLPDDHFELMGYCVDRWISPRTYLGMMTRLAPRAAAPRQLARLEPLPEPHALVAGTIVDGEVAWQPIFVVDVSAPPAPGGASYRIEVWSTPGAEPWTRQLTLNSVAVDLDPADADAGPLDLPEMFTVAVPLGVFTAASEVALVDDRGEALGVLPLGGLAPQIALEFPAGGETLDSATVVEWTVSDDDNATPADHAFLLDYSADGGETWQSLAEVRGITELTVDFGELPGADGAALLRVQASDGVHTATAVSPPFSVPRKLPLATIVSPAPGATFSRGKLVHLRAAVEDPDERSFPDASIRWESDRDGALGEGTELSLSSLSEGTHSITVSAMDADGNLTESSVEIQVTPRVLPSDAPTAAEEHSVSVKILGEGRVVSSPVGLDCSEECAITFRGGTTLNLEAIEFRDRRFEGWGGDCEEFGDSMVCALPQDAPGPFEVTAEFSVNRPPLIVTQTHLVVDSGSMVTLVAGRSSDPDGDRIGYTWRQIAGLPVELEYNGNGSTRFTAPDRDAELSIELRVSDLLAESVATITVRVVRVPFVLAFGERGTEEGQFRSPHGVAVDSEGTIWLADSANHRLQKFDPTGRFLLSAGSEGDEAGEFQFPWDVAVGGGGTIWVSDHDNRRLQKLDGSGRFLLAVGSPGDGEGQFGASFGGGPSAIAFEDGRVFVCDSGNHRVQVFDDEGGFLFTFGRFGSLDGEFRNPNGITVDSDGRIVVADTGRDRMQVFTSEGEFLYGFGERGTEPGQFDEPHSVSFLPDGNLVLLNSSPVTQQVQILDPTGAFRSGFGASGSREGQLSRPEGLSVDAAAAGGPRIVVADTGNNRVQVFGLPAPTPARSFLRGDGNGDGEIDFSDAVCTLNWLFLGSKDPGCIAALNTNGDEAVDIADPVYSLFFSFLGGPAPVAPYPDCGSGTLPTDEAMGCETPPKNCQQ